MIDKKELLQIGTKCADKYLSEKHGSLTKGCKSEKHEEIVMSRYKKVYKKGFRKGLKLMRYQIRESFEAYAKAHCLSPIVRNEILELLSFKK